MRVLLIDDDDVFRAYVKAMLEAEGHEVVERISGDDAATTLADAAIELLITDIRLRDGMNGWSVAECCRALQPGLPVIYMTSYTGVERRDVPGSRFLLKPFRPPTLRYVIERAVEVRQAAHA